METYRQQWQSLQEQVDQWQKVLQQKSDTLLAASHETQSLRETWARIDQTDIPESVSERIESTLSLLQTFDKDLKEQVEAALTLQNQVSDFRIRVGDGLRGLEEVEVQLRERLFVRDSDSLWQVLAGARSQTTSLNS